MPQPDGVAADRIKRQAADLARKTDPASAQRELCGYHPCPVTLHILMTTFETAFGSGASEKGPARLTPWARRWKLVPGTGALTDQTGWVAQRG